MASGAGGYGTDMRFKLGFVAGFAAGYWVGMTPAEERRAKIDQMWSGVRENPRIQRVSDSVTRDAKRLGDAVEQRLVSTTDSAADAVAGTVERGATSTTTSSGSSSGDATRRTA